ncbi:MAG: hypothetical protein II954_03425, partial [Synergistaceae bacterium]|nr:hypothetical protein [Synergistaceae bacterium]
MNAFTRKLRKAKRLLSEGDYGELFSRLLSNVPLYRTLERNAKYLYLHRKYRSFNDERASVIRTGGGV